MTERAQAALIRIEAAAARLEHVLTARRVPEPDPALARLEERHGRLRAETAAALARLDRLLAPAGESENGD